MIEIAWNRSIDPAKMLTFLRESDKLSERKARLFAVACCRRIWPLLTDARSRTAVDVAERLADGRADNRERYAARSAAAEAANEARHTAGDPTRGGRPAWRAAGAATFVASSAAQVLEAVDWASLAAGEEVAGDKLNKAGYAEQEQQAMLLRHLFNPFRLGKSFTIRWKTPTVLSLAAKAYQSRIQPAGHLDPACINVLFDALVNADCREIDLLDHLGGTAPHPPGCWAVDLILEKS